VLTRFRVQGVTTQGLPLSGELYLQGPVGDGSTIVFLHQPDRSPYAYPPAQYDTPCPRSTRSRPTSPSSTPGRHTEREYGGLRKRGTFIPDLPDEDPATVTLTLGGPFAGSVTWTDTVSLLSPPANDVGHVCHHGPGRTSACRRRTPSPRSGPRLVAGETIAGTPTWTVNGIPAGAATALAYTFTTPGTPHRRRLDDHVPRGPRAQPDHRVRPDTFTIGP